VVHRARRGGEEYAVKMLLDPEPDPAEVAAFRREAALLASLDHPGVTRIHEVGAAAGRPYQIMELISGGSLSQALAGGPLAEARAVEVVRQVAHALAVAHGAGLIHRDVKTDNIMIRPDSTACLIDFGLAGRADRGLADAAVGTLIYSSPEQTGLLRRPVDGRADLYSLGVVLYECLVGAPPFPADDAGELIRLHLSTPPPPVSARRPDVSAAIGAVVERLLAKDPDDRYASAEELAATLDRIAAGASTPDEATTGARGTGAVRAGPLGAGPLGAGQLGAGQLGAGREGHLVGRVEESRRLAARWHEARAGRGGLVLVQGPPGGGKSRLVRHVADGVVDHPVLAGKCLPDSAVPMAALRAAVDVYLAGLSHLDPDHRAAAEERLRAVARDEAGLLAALSPALAAFLAVSESDPHSDQRRFADAVAELLAGLADAHGGAVLLLDDAQWADEPTRRVLRQLAGRIGRSRLLVLATARDDPASAAAVDELLAELGGAVEPPLGLGPLDEAAVARLIGEQRGSLRLPETVLQRVATRSAGNPLAVLEYVRAIVDAGLLTPAWGAWRLDEAGLEALDLPADVVDLVLRRIDGLGDTARGLLTAAAAVGHRFAPDLVARVCGVDGPDAVAAFAHTAERRLVDPVEGGALVFVHDRVREALLGALDPAATRRLHQRIAEELESELESEGRAGEEDERVYAIAEHYLRGEVDHAPDRLHRAATAAGVLALRQYQPAGAVRFRPRAAAAAAAAGLPLAAGFRITFGRAASQAGAYDLADRQFGIALAAETRPMGRAQLYAMLSENDYLRARGVHGGEMARCGLAELGHPVPRHPVALAVTTLALFLGGLVLGVLPARWVRASGGRWEVYRLRTQLSMLAAYNAGVSFHPPLMAAFNLRLVHLRHRLRYGVEYARTLGGSAVVAAVAGRMRLAGRLLARSVAAAEATGDLRLVANVHWLHGIVYDVVRPLHHGSGHHMREALLEHERYIDMGEYLNGAGIVGVISVFRGYTDDAARWHARCVARVPANSDDFLGNTVAIVGPQVAALTGRPAEAVARLREVRDYLVTAPENRAQQVNVAFTAVQLAFEQGETGPAFDEAVAEFTALNLKPAMVFSFHHPFWVYQAFGRLAQVAAAPAEDRAARLAQARRAVGQLRRAAAGPVLRAFHRTAEAELRLLSGDHIGALRRLAAVEVDGAVDVPRLGYDVARVRARTYTALGRPEDARRQAAIALALADEHGWVNRGRWIRGEFGLGPAAGVGRSTRTRLTASGTVSAGSVDVHGRRLEAVHQVSLASASTLDPDQVARVALDEIVRIFAAERAFLLRHDDTTGQLVPYLGRDATGEDVPELTGYGSTLVQRVYDSGEAVVVTGSEEGAALGSRSAVIHGLRSIMVAPLAVHGRVLGVVYLDSRAARGLFTTDDIAILVAIANQVALSLETARTAQLELAVHAARRQRDLAEALRRTLAELVAARDPRQVCHRLLRSLVEAVPAHAAILLLREGADGPLTVAAHLSDVDRQPRDGAEVDLTAEPGLAALLSAPGPVGRSTAEQAPPLPGLLGPRSHAWLAIPLHLHGEQRGLLLAATPNPEFTDTELEIAATLSSQGLVALDNATLFQRVEDLATRDGLTGLHNRRHFTSLATEHLAPGPGRERAAAVMVDIDHFKRINDAYGHGVGDQVIQAVARRLADNLRAGDLICRYGGEEFAVLLPATSDAHARTVADRLWQAIAQTPVETAAGPLEVTVSVGLAPAPPPGTDLTAALDVADAALYEAKRSGRNRVVVAGAT
jgi:diguanylate cyclase (GGDEF)-like protein